MAISFERRADGAERPLLFPNMDTLNKHRAIKHPAPAMSTHEAAAAAASIISSLQAPMAKSPVQPLTTRGALPTSEMVRQTSIEAPDIEPASEQGPVVVASASRDRSYEYITWFFTPEEEARRRAFLPLQ